MANQMYNILVIGCKAQKAESETVWLKKSGFWFGFPDVLASKYTLTDVLSQPCVLSFLSQPHRAIHMVLDNTSYIVSL